MPPIVGLTTCTGDPYKCAEADIEALAALGVKAVINPKSWSGISAAKISYTKLEGVTWPGEIPAVLGPGVQGYEPTPGGKPAVLIRVDPGRVHLESEGYTRNIPVGECGGDIIANALAALAAGYLALGYDAKDAASLAVEHLDHSMKYWGCTPKPISRLEARAYRAEVLDQVKDAAETLLRSGGLLEKAGLVPEVGINVAMALPHPYARGIGDVAAIPGRIRRAGGGLLAATTCPSMGASSHLARAILEVMKRHPSIRAGVNILYRGKVLEAAESLGFTVSSYDRSREPPEVKAREGATIPWGIGMALDRLAGREPDLIYHYGDWGKEPMAIVFGRTAAEAVGKTLSLASLIVGG